MAWDPRIHSGNKAQLAKSGRWKRLRGIDQKEADEIERASLDTPPPPPVADTDTDTVDTFPKLMALIGSLGLSADTVNAIVISCGVGSLPELGSRLDLIPTVAETFRSYVP